MCKQAPLACSDTHQPHLCGHAGVVLLGREHASLHSCWLTVRGPVNSIIALPNCHSCESTVCEALLGTAGLLARDLKTLFLKVGLTTA